MCLSLPSVGKTEEKLMAFTELFHSVNEKSKLITLQFLLRITKVKKTLLKSTDVELDFATCSLGDV